MFADSPSGGGTTEPPDASGRRSILLHKARHKKTRGPGAGAADTSRLLEEAASEANLAQALLNVVRNKGAPGVDGQTVEAAEAKAPSIIARLRRDLLAECYRPGDVRRVWLPKPGGGRRGLGIPNVVDRVVQQAVLQVLEPVFEPTFHASSHGFRPKRGAHTAIAEATGYLKDGYQTVVDLDLASFFDRVHHQRLLARIAQRVTDQRMVSLIHLMLKAAVVMPDGTKVAVQEGTPQGGPLSPLLSNIVLNEMDGELARRGSFDTPTIAISSCGANAPGSASWHRSGDFWSSACGSRSTRRKVACESRTRFTSWVFAFDVGRMAARSPYSSRVKRENG
jgi:RNA-directed DNA polymerase